MNKCCYDTTLLAAPASTRHSYVIEENIGCSMGSLDMCMSNDISS